MVTAISFFFFFFWKGKLGFKFCCDTEVIFKNQTSIKIHALQAKKITFNENNEEQAIFINSTCIIILRIWSTF